MQFDKFHNYTLITEIPLNDQKIEIVPPSGTDNYFLLACEEPITNAALIFNQQGVNSGVESRGLRSDSNPLSDLLDIGNAGSRGMPSQLPATWSLQKSSYRCTY